MFGEMTSRTEGGVELDVLVWRLDQPMLVASSAICGGGLGPRHWILNAEVPNDYGRVDGEQHVAELAAVLGLDGPGVGMLTAAHMRHHQRSSDGGVDVEVTVGLSHPTWAASDEVGEIVVTLPGTVNIVAFLPVRLEDGALLNAVVSATEAKSQALWEASIPATGTPSDAVCVVCPLVGDPERFGGPRSLWGARLARSVHRAVLAGARQWAP
jgi:adenosylcobinamide hydrolase